MTKIITEAEEKESKNAQRERKEVAEQIATFERIRQEGMSQRQVAEQLNIARTTIQHWLKRKENLGADKEVREFFESQSGLAILHQVVIASQFVMTQVGPSGIRMVSLFLELSGLARFVASSYGSQQQVNVAMEKAIVEFGGQEGKRLGTGMKMKKISVCQDETFHPETCLVGIEPVSNFILVEKYAKARDAESWNQAMKQAVDGLAVQIIQSTSDEAKGILAHVGKGLGVHHSPDLFHIQSELTKATSVGLASQTNKAQDEYEKAVEKLSQRETEKADYLAQGGCHNAIYFDQRVEKAEQIEQAAKQHLAVVESRQKRAQDAVKAISTTYHPFDLQSGLKRSPEQVASLLEEHFLAVQQVAKEAELSEVSHKRIQKAHKLLPQMCATITFFFQMIINYVQQQSLSLELENVIYKQLIPGFYLELVAAKAKSAEQRKIILTNAQSLISAATTPDSIFNRLEKDQQQQIKNLAKDCAQLFQRSSSCVEGRNGQLSLRHHSLHRLSNRKLNALTTVHNYFLKRSDGSTAAQRFFGQQSQNLFDYLLATLPLPARPAKKRSILAVDLIAA